MTEYIIDFALKYLALCIIATCLLALAALIDKSPEKWRKDK